MAIRKLLLPLTGTAAGGLPSIRVLTVLTVFTGVVSDFCVDLLCLKLRT